VGKLYLEILFKFLEFPLCYFLFNEIGGE